MFRKIVCLFLFSLFFTSILTSQNVKVQIPWYNKNFKNAVDTMKLIKAIEKESGFFDFKNNYVQVYITKNPNEYIAVKFSRKSLVCEEFIFNMVNDKYQSVKTPRKIVKEDFDYYYPSKNDRIDIDKSKSNSNKPLYYSPALFASAFNTDDTDYGALADAINYGYTVAQNEGWWAQYCVKGPTQHLDFVNMMPGKALICATGHGVAAGSHFYLCSGPVWYGAGICSGGTFFLLSCHQFSSYWLNSWLAGNFIGSPDWISVYDGYWTFTHWVDNALVYHQTLQNSVTNANPTWNPNLFQIAGPGINSAIYPKKVKLNFVEERSNIIPEKTQLYPNYPNPFNPSTKITFDLKNSDYINLKIYDISGREVRTIVDGFREDGKYSYEFNAASLPSGIYYYWLKTGNYSEMKKMILMK